MTVDDWAVMVLAVLTIFSGIALLVIAVADMRWSWRTRDAPWRKWNRKNHG